MMRLEIESRSGYGESLGMTEGGKAIKGGKTLEINEMAHSAEDRRYAAQKEGRNVRRPYIGIDRKESLIKLRYCSE